jgi:hypothetical protein
MKIGFRLTECGLVLINRYKLIIYDFVRSKKHKCREKINKKLQAFSFAIPSLGSHVSITFATSICLHCPSIITLENCIGFNEGLF